MKTLRTHEKVPIAKFWLKAETINFNHASLALLNKPKYVQFLYEAHKKLLLVVGNNEKLPCSLAVPKSVYFDSKKYLRICHKHLTEAFALRLGWDKNENYRVAGALNPNLNMVVFELTQAALNRHEQNVLE